MVGDIPTIITMRKSVLKKLSIDAHQHWLYVEPMWYDRKWRGGSYFISCHRENYPSEETKRLYVDIAQAVVEKVDLVKSGEASWHSYSYSPSTSGRLYIINELRFKNKMDAVMFKLTRAELCI